MIAEGLDHLKRNAARVREVLGVLVKYGLADWLQWLDVDWIQNHLRSKEGARLHDQPLEARIRLALTELGTTFIKLGQILSTRPDVVGTALAEELSNLQAHTQADPPAVAHATLAAELGPDPETRFRYFEGQAFASASIAQVHRATLLTGEPVVVKVMRAGVKHRAETDLEILRALADLLEKHTSFLRAYQPVKLVRQFQRTLRQELDFTHERRNLEQFAHAFADDETVHIPQVYKELCTTHVLTMEFLEGVSAADANGIDAAGITAADFARRGADMYLAMIFRDCFYHADPHPGNLLALPGGVVGVLDCGMVGRIDEALRQDVEAMLLAAVEKDTHELCEALLRVGHAPPDIDRKALTEEVAEFLDDYMHRALTDLDLGETLGAVFGIIHRYRIVLPPQLSLLLRTLIVLEGTSRALDRDFSIAELIEPFYHKAVRRRLSPRRLWRRLWRSGRDWERLIAGLPCVLRQVLDHLRAGTLRVQFEHRRIEASVNRLTLAMLVAALILGSSALWVSSAPPRLGDSSLLGLVGYLLALYLGCRLWRAAKKSPDRDR